jgi:hypothetical protein
MCRSSANCSPYNWCKNRHYAVLYTVEVGEKNRWNGSGTKKSGNYDVRFQARSPRYTAMMPQQSRQKRGSLLQGQLTGL